MCYHVSVHSSKDKFTKRFKAIIEDEELFSNQNFHVSGFSHRKLPVITEEQPDLIQGYNWGLIPFFMKDITSAKQSRIHCLNAKSETIFEKPSFRTPIMKRRCLVYILMKLYHPFLRKIGHPFLQYCTTLLWQIQPPSFFRIKRA